MEKRILELSWVSLWRVLFFIALAAVLLQGLNVLLGLFLAIVISSGLEFLVNFMEKRGIPRTLGVIVIFLLAAILVIVLVAVVLPLLIIEFNTALVTLERIAAESWWGPLAGLRATQSLSEIMNRITRAVFPGDYEDTALRIYENSRRRIGLWFRSQILLSLTMGFLTLIALSILGVKYAVLLGLLAAVFELVPYIGPILAGSAAVMAALTASPTLAFWTLVVFVILHQVESHFLVPMLVGRSVGLHPVIVIAALLMGAEVGGFLGILISVPAAVVVQEIVEFWAGKRRPRAVPLI